MRLKYHLALLLFFGFLTSLSAQNQAIVIDTIIVEGNKRTKTATILRELTFKKGDTLQTISIQDTINQNKLWLMGTGLFNEVHFTIKDWTKGGSIKLLLTVKETFFLIPQISITPGDRNFTVWWTTYNRDLSRLNYALNIYYRNLTGQNDRIKVSTQFGFENKYVLNYQLPFFNKAKTLGLEYDLFFANGKNWGFKTTDNQLVFDSDSDRVVIQRFRTKLGINYRPKTFTKHQLDIAYFRNTIPTTMAERHPDFFLHSRAKQQYFALIYTLTNDRRNYRPYPTTGNYFEGQLSKEGIGIFDDLDAFYLSALYAQYFTLKPKWSTAFVLKGRYALSRNQQIPYFNSRALGYQPDFIRGYEFYVIDGLDYGLGQFSLRYELLNKVFHLPKWMIKPLRFFPIRIYPKVFSDQGYVNNPYYGGLQNTFTNTWLWSAGFGMDFVIYNDFIVQTEYTWNKLGENNFYLNFKLPF